MSEDELTNAIIKIKPDKTAGHDKITNKLLKAAGQSICETLILYIFNLVLEIGIFPDDLKQINVMCNVEIVMWKLQTNIRDTCNLQKSWKNSFLIS